MRGEGGRLVLNGSQYLCYYLYSSRESRTLRRGSGEVEGWTDVDDKTILFLFFPYPLSPILSPKGTDFPELPYSLQLPVNSLSSLSLLFFISNLVLYVCAFSLASIPFFFPLLLPSYPPPLLGYTYCSMSRRSTRGEAVEQIGATPNGDLGDDTGTSQSNSPKSSEIGLVDGRGGRGRRARKASMDSPSKRNGRGKHGSLI